MDENIGYGEFEFERRFWVRDFPRQIAGSPALIVQNYFLADGSTLPGSRRSAAQRLLGAGEGYAIRVRCQISDFTIDDDDAKSLDPTFLNAKSLLLTNRDAVDFAAITVKGPAAGGTRYESERELDTGVGVELIARGSAVVAKLRYSAWIGQDGWVIDVFLGENAPLIVAECERSSPVTDLEIPEFCFTEITDDHRFANDSLALNPYQNWRRAYEQELAGTGQSFRQDFGTNQ